MKKIYIYDHISDLTENWHPEGVQLILEMGQRIIELEAAVDIRGITIEVYKRGTSELLKKYEVLQEENNRLSLKLLEYEANKST